MSTSPRARRAGGLVTADLRTRIEQLALDGPVKDNTWQGIYELKGDTLKVCYAEAGKEKERPTEFKTLKKSGLLLVELKREKK